MRTITEFIAKYEGGTGDYRSEKPVTSRISPEAYIKLETLAAHFGQKKSPLAGEILEAAINEIFDQVSPNFSDDLERQFAEEMHEMQSNI